MGRESTRREINALARDCDSIYGPALASLPSIPCHNDLHHDNALFTSRDGRPAFVFIDWELFGMNRAGADLHHFVRFGLQDSAFRPFSRALLERYAEWIGDSRGIDRRAVSLGAHAYALFRCMGRAVRRHDARQIPLAIRLSRRVQLLLSLMPVWLLRDAVLPL